MDITKIDLHNPEPSVIQRAVKTMQNGGVVIYPTDTSYGIGGNALDKTVIVKIYEIKGREFNQPTHVIVRDWEMIQKLCETNEVAMKLYNKFLPGPLTLILPKKDIIPDLLTANLPTLGVRIPSNEVTRLMSAVIDFPYTTPSANISGGKTPYSIQESLEQFSPEQKELIDLVLDAGELSKVDPSTIIDCSSDTPKILRQGPITQGQIESVLSIKVQ